MKSSYISNENVSIEGEKMRRNTSFRIGTVDAVFEKDNIVRVRYSNSNHTTCEVLTTTSGDTWYPSVEDTAIVGPRDSGDDLLLGIVSPSSYEVVSGERIIGHDGSDTRFKFNSDGSVDVFADGSDSAVCTIDSDGIHIADGQVMTDVQTNTDADGHVTSVTPVYTTTLSL